MLEPFPPARWNCLKKLSSHGSFLNSKFSFSHKKTECRLWCATGFSFNVMHRKKEEEKMIQKFKSEEEILLFSTLRLDRMKTKTKETVLRNCFSFRLRLFLARSQRRREEMQSKMVDVFHARWSFTDVARSEECKMRSVKEKFQSKAKLVSKLVLKCNVRLLVAYFLFLSENVLSIFSKECN